jgi:RNA polymerase sigma-70 factor (ECF subfamily)
VTPQELVVKFDQFYRANYPALARALVFTLGDVDLGTEAADEAMARCYAQWSQVSTYDNKMGWVYRVGLNWARSVHRRLSRKLPLASRAVIEPEFSDPWVAAAVAALDTDLRAVVVCRLWADWSVAQTADALGIRPGTVKSRLHRALFVLRSHLSDRPSPPTTDGWERHDSNP